MLQLFTALHPLLEVINELTLFRNKQTKIQIADDFVYRLQDNTQIIAHSTYLIQM